MNIPLVKESGVRVHQTAGAVMTTLISPSLGGSDSTSMWKVSMSGGQSGPAHVISSEQIWHVIAGRASITVDGETLSVEAGDTLAIPRGAVRQVVAIENTLFGVYGDSDAKASAGPDDADAATPPWMR